MTSNLDKRILRVLRAAGEPLKARDIAMRLLASGGARADVSEGALTRSVNQRLYSSVMRKMVARAPDYRWLPRPEHQTELDSPIHSTMRQSGPSASGITPIAEDHLGRPPLINFGKLSVVEQVCCFGTFYAMANIDRAIHPKELAVILASADQAKLPDALRRGIANFRDSTPDYEGSLKTLANSSYDLRCAVALHLMTIAYADDVLEPQERDGIDTAVSILGIEPSHCESMEYFVEYTCWLTQFELTQEERMRRLQEVASGLTQAGLPPSSFHFTRIAGERLRGEASQIADPSATSAASTHAAVLSNVATQTDLGNKAHTAAEGDSRFKAQPSLRRAEKSRSQTEPPGVECLLRALDSTPRSRSDLLARSGLAPNRWQSVVTYLVNAGQVYRSGKKRGTLYSVGLGNAPAPDWLARPAQKRDTTSIKRKQDRQEKKVEVYNDFVFDILAELGASD